MSQSSVLKPFDPAVAGTPEREWRRMLHGAAPWEPRKGPLVVAAPHPDDEILGAGGLIHAWAASGEPVTVISVTDGEAADLSRERLDLVRRKELLDALRVLSPVHINLQRLAIPDGKVVNHAVKVRDVIADYATAGATIVAPYEFDGHPDHEVVGRACAAVASTSGVTLARYPIWTWHHTVPKAVESLRWVRFPLTHTTRRAKARALQCFESQLRPSSGRPIIPANVLAYFQRPYEAFVL
jgi:LmbE family N-acetylglucosaminyl deacetylase